MKKYITALFVIMAIVMFSSVAYATEDYTITELECRNVSSLKGSYYCDIELMITKNTDADQATLISSYYAEDGRFLGVATKELYLEKGECREYKHLSPEVYEQPAVVKITIWDGLYRFSMMEPKAVSRILYPPKLNTNYFYTEMLCDGYSAKVDGKLSENDSEYAGLEFERVTTTDGTIVDNGAAILRLKKPEATSNSDVIEYRLKNAKLYVNGYEFCDVNYNNAEDVIAMLQNACREDYYDCVATLVRDTSLPGTVYNKIMMDYYVIASVDEILKADGQTELRLSGMADIPSAIAANPGESFVVDDDTAKSLYIDKRDKYDIYIGYYFSLLAVDDVVAFRYNIKHPLSDYGRTFDDIEIDAACWVVQGVYHGYDQDMKKYKIGNSYYKTIKPLQLTQGTEYIFRLDNFGRIFDVSQEIEPRKCAIVERYEDMYDVGEDDFIDIVTFEGESKRLYIEKDRHVIINYAMEKAGIGSSQADTAKNIPIQDRIIMYDVDISTGKVIYATFLDNAKVFTDCSKKSLLKVLSSSATVIDATEYVEKSIRGEASSGDYRVASMAELKDGIEYYGVLIEINGDDKQDYVIITRAGSTYTKDTDFAVVAKTAGSGNCVVVDGEKVFRLTVMEYGNNSYEMMNVCETAKIYVNGVEYSYQDYCSTYLKQGAVFLCTKDADELVERIDVILEGGYDYDTIKSLITEEYDTTKATIDDMIMLPSASEIRKNTWCVDIDEKDNDIVVEQIQLFIAPVVSSSSQSVLFGTLKVEGNSLYIDTNDTYKYALRDDTNLYEYNLSESYWQDAFGGGCFEGFDADAADMDGKAWIKNAPDGSVNFDGEVQFAFVMAVDGEITNALIFSV